MPKTMPCAMLKANGIITMVRKAGIEMQLQVLRLYGSCCTENNKGKKDFS
jgi:hypothetical protein